MVIPRVPPCNQWKLPVYLHPLGLNSTRAFRRRVRLSGRLGRGGFWPVGSACPSTYLITASSSTSCTAASQFSPLRWPSPPPGCVLSPPPSWLPFLLERMGYLTLGSWAQPAAHASSPCFWASCAFAALQLQCFVPLGQCFVLGKDPTGQERLQDSKPQLSAVRLTMAH